MSVIKLEKNIIDLLKIVGIDYYGDLTPFQKESLISELENIIDGSDIIDDAKENSYKEGYKDGKDEGFSNAETEMAGQLDEEFDKGFKEGHSEGYELGYRDGRKEAIDEFENQ